MKDILYIILTTAIAAGVGFLVFMLVSKNCISVFGNFLCTW